MKKTTYTPYSADNDEIDFGQQLRVIWTNKYKILAALLAGGILGAAFSLASTPQYRADAMLEIETRQNQILTEINSIFNNQTTPSEAEVELVQSRLVLGKTVDDLQLDQEVKAKYTPVIGSLMHNISGDPDPKLTVGSFTVQDEWFNKTFTLTAKSNKAYTLTLPDKRVVEGKVGVPLKINNQTTLKIDQILANPGQEFALTKFSRISAIENIQNKLAVISKGKTSPIINLTFTGTDPKRTSVILNSIADNYVAQNRERDVQVASSGLAFISEELPRLKETLQDAENKLNAYRQQSGSLDIPLESKGALESLTGIETQITLLKTEEAGLAELYTPEHPSYKAVLDKLAVLERAKNKINQQIAELPNTQQEVIRLTRDVETNQATYVQLLAKQQELNIMKASAQGNVRVVDHAYTPEKPIAPRKAVITALGALAAGALASMWFLLQGRMRRGITSSEEIEALDLEVSALIPHSKTQQKRDLIKRKFKSLKGRSTYLLANEDSTDIAVEAIRALRTNIYFSMLDARNNILMITGAAPEAGKSFISANLATVMAQSGKRVLLIDTDMRKGYLDQLLNVTPECGLSDILSGEVSPAQAVIQTNIPNLHLISAGSYPKNPSELLMDNRFKELLSNAQKRYDYVIIDTPPVLAVTDAVVVGQHAGTVLLVSRYGNTTAKELAISAERLRQNKITIKGVILNGMKREANSTYDYYYSYITPAEGKKTAKKTTSEKPKA